MIEIKQFSPIGKDLNIAFNRLGEVRINIDSETIKNDINNLDRMAKTTYSKMDRKNIKELKIYLTNILKRYTGDQKIIWSVKNGLAESSPVKLVRYPEYNIDCTNYVTISNNEKMVVLDYSNIAELISFELMYRDIQYNDDCNYNHRIIEKLLYDIGIVSVTDFEIIKKRLFSDYSPYEFSKSFKIENSPYINIETRQIRDYFNHREFEIDNYYKVIDYSTKHAMALIFKELSNSKLLNSFLWKLIAINNTQIVLILNVEDDFDIKNKLYETAVIRCLGRKFEVKPNIIVY